MALPKNRTSITKKRSRLANWKRKAKEKSKLAWSKAVSFARNEELKRKADEKLKREEEKNELIVKEENNLISVDQLKEEKNPMS